MLPVLKQRLLIAAALVLGGLIWLLAVHPLSAVGGWSGISLIDPRASIPLAVVLVLLIGLPAIGLALITASTGHPISGVFVFAAALSFPAGAGGAIDGLLYRAQLPQAYLYLALEMLFWALLLVGFLVLARQLRGPVRQRFRPLTVKNPQHEQVQLALPNAAAIIAGIVTAILAAVLLSFLVQVSDLGQIIGGLILAFLLASVLTQSLMPQANPVLILLSPALVAIAVYAMTYIRYPTHDALIGAWHGSQLIGMAQILPIHYISAGVVGCCLGLGLADYIHRAREQQPQQAANNDPTAT